MPTDTCNTCTEYLCPEQGIHDDCKCKTHTTVPMAKTNYEERLAAIREMKIEQGKNLCRTHRIIVFKNGELIKPPYYFTEEEYLLISQAPHFLPRLHTKKLRPALEITIEKSTGVHQVILLSPRGDSRW